MAWLGPLLCELEGSVEPLGALGEALLEDAPVRSGSGCAPEDVGGVMSIGSPEEWLLWEGEEERTGRVRVLPGP